MYKGRPAVLLGDGTVFTDAAIVMNPDSLEWSSVQPTQRSYFNNTLTKLNDGSVIEIGRIDRDYEIYDPSTGTWNCCGQTLVPRNRQGLIRISAW